MVNIPPHHFNLLSRLYLTCLPFAVVAAVIALIIGHTKEGYVLIASTVFDIAGVIFAQSKTPRFVTMFNILNIANIIVLTYYLLRHMDTIYMNICDICSSSGAGPFYTEVFLVGGCLILSLVITIEMSAIQNKYMTNKNANLG